MHDTLVEPFLDPISSVDARNLSGVSLGWVERG